MTIKTSVTLPEKLSDLMILALKDLEAVEQNPEYEINMGEWFYNDEGICHVCYAGAVMANTLDIKINDGVYVTPGSFEVYIEERLLALDSVRTGNITDAFDTMGIWTPGSRQIESEIIYASGQKWPTRYHDNPVQFKDDMRHIIATLISHDL